jgi:hypothetical protein
LGAFPFNQKLGAYKVAADSKEHSYPERAKVLRDAAVHETMAEYY